MSADRVNNLLGHLAKDEQSLRNAGVAPVCTSAIQSAQFGTIGSKNPDDVVIVSALRTAIGKARKGSFKDTTPDDLLLAVFKGVVAEAKIDPKELGDVVVGNVQTVGAYSMPARTAQFRAGFPETVGVRAVNRQCSSGLQAVASVASEIKSGYIDAGIGAGVESMTNGGNPGDPNSLPPMNLNEIFSNTLASASLTPMGITSETVAERYGITREEQDAMAAESHKRALQAQKDGKFDREIVPVKVTIEDKDGNEKEVVVSKDDGPRAGTTVEGLAKLKPAFKKGGSTTAGNSSQVSDGAAAVLLMRRSKAEELGAPIIGVFRGFKVVGVLPDEMGIGPAAAIPALLEDTKLAIGDIDIYEINEAFASQATYCVKKLGIPMSKVNPLGGAIALGHPLGMTGARQVATLLHELRRTKKKTGIVSMCIGTGMGAAGLFEAV
mmetsp:Transcript_662/g.795  ORF Transcript_662/g.795 Transcript_662/m.795 type:complete len:438 (-) Transcript_662:168-1481(-)|eukprot:CAMPEP_0204828392 /NCGR_PEP_ID=MMETSP1346-20131115/6124_1 /ASSEMBLY_ACC=CAM_ASM_000771 /TAXON_ID=215587 /ORGANISM="Aplanochytrium stocchinoi, Strain GSBS06" /LENGTH=437 /DNA_ID=CAMNT_0051957423 /DNA_START=133 /DNA_END=1446 /DNA_ORIENTATION=+